MSTEEKKELIPTTAKELMEKALNYYGSIQSIEVKNDEHYQNAANVCKNIKGHIKSLDNKRKELVKPLNDDVKYINGEFKEITSKLDNGEKQLKRAMAKYYQEQERKRLEEQRKREAEAEAKRKAAEEKARKEAEKAEQYKATGREDMAEKAEARAESQLNLATNTVAEEVEEKKQKGVSYRTKYKCRIKDLKTAAMHCLQNDSFNYLISLDVPKIAKLADSTKGAMKIPGIEYVEEKVVAVRS